MARRGVEISGSGCWSVCLDPRAEDIPPGPWYALSHPSGPSFPMLWLEDPRPEGRAPPIRCFEE